MTNLNHLRWRQAIVFALLLILAASLDRTLALWASAAPRGLRTLGQVLTALGTSGYMFAGALLVIAVAYVRLRREPPGSSRRVACADQIRRALYFFTVVATSGLAAQALKHIVGRVRPHAAGFDPLQFIPFSTKASFASFPSGHATSAFAAATALTLLLRRGRWPLFVLATLIAASRVVVGAHFPTDVVCGAALGAITAIALADYRVWQDRLASAGRRFAAKLATRSAG